MNVHMIIYIQLYSLTSMGNLGEFMELLIPQPGLFHRRSLRVVPAGRQAATATAPRTDRQYLASRQKSGVWFLLRVWFLSGQKSGVWFLSGFSVSEVGCLVS